MPSQPQPAGPFLGAPPQLPTVMQQQLDPALLNWLSRFSLWCQGNFNSTLQKRTATGAIFMRSAGGEVWSLTVDDNGQLRTTQMNPGSGP